MKRFYVLALLLCLFGMGKAQLDCTTFVERDAQQTALFLYLPTYTGCAAEPTYVIDYRPSSGGSWTNINPFYVPHGGPYDSFFFFGLTACTEYEVRVQIFCQGTPVGVCTELFRTEGCAELDCGDVTVGNIGTTTADITISNQSSCADPVTNEISYEFRLKKSSDPWGSFNPGQTLGTINLTGLDACTKYEYEIRLICNGAPTTVCSGEFETECGDCGLVSVTNIEDNSADIILNGFDDCRDGGALTYDIRWRKVPGTWTSLTNQSTTGNIHSLTGLEDCSNYEYEITIKCNGEEVLCTGSFLTTGCEVKPCDGVTVPYVSNDRAYIQFTGFEDCEVNGTYNVRYWVHNHTTGSWNWYSHNLGQNFFAIFNLDPCTDYTVELEILCDGVWSNVCTVTFTTDGPCVVSQGNQSKKTIFAETPVTAFPNPFNTGLTLEFGMQATEEVTVVLHDMMGKEVYRNTGLYNAGLNKIRIDGKDLPAGLLFFTVDAGDEKKTGRVVKQ